MRKLLQRFLRRNEAATAVEYAVMLALILMVMFAAIVLVGQSTKSSLDTTNSHLSDVGFGAGS